MKNSSQPTILLVEDNVAHIELTRRALSDSSLDANLLVATCIQEAKEILEQHTPHLILADYLLSDGKGTDLLEDCKHNPPCPHLIVTSQSDTNAAVAAIKAGAADYVIKQEDYWKNLPHVVGRTLTAWDNQVQRKKVEEELAAVRTFNDTIISSVGEGIMVVDKQQRVLVWNRFMEELSGYSADEVFGKPLLELFPVLAERGIGELIEAAFEGKNIQTPDVPLHISRNKKDIWVMSRVTSHRGPAGEIVGAVGIVHDITNRKRSEVEQNRILEETRQKQTEVSAFLKATQAVLKGEAFEDTARVIFDICKEMVSATSGYVALLSKDGSENEVLFLDSGGGSCTVDPELPMPVRGLRSKAYETGKTVFDNDFMQSEWAVFMPKGHVQLENVLFAPLVVEGKVVGLLGLANKEGGFTQEDARLATGMGELVAITLLNKWNIQSLRESEEKYRSLVEEIGDAVYIFDGEGIIQYFSPAVERILGYSFDELAGVPFKRIIAPEEHAILDKRVEALMKGDIPQPHIYHLLAKNGDTKYALLSSKPHYQGGKIVGITGLMSDMTEQKRLEEAILTSQKMVGVGTLTAGVAHEIRSPLQVITLASEGLIRRLKRDQIDPERLLPQLETINRNAWRIAGIARSLLNYARATDSDFELYELNEIVHDTLLLIEHQLAAWSNIVVETDLQSNLPHLRCDRNKVTQILINLLMNARDAMPDGGTICISTDVDVQVKQVILKVADNGSGIPAEIKEKIFEPFFTTKASDSGTGLGLALVKDIVTVHGGTIELLEPVEQGTVFKIGFPIPEDARLQEAALLFRTY